MGPTRAGPRRPCWLQVAVLDQDFAQEGLCLCCRVGRSFLGLGVHGRQYLRHAERVSVCSSAASLQLSCYYFSCAPLCLVAGSDPIEWQRPIGPRENQPLPVAPQCSTWDYNSCLRFILSILLESLIILIWCPFRPLRWDGHSFEFASPAPGLVTRECLLCPRANVVQ